MTSEDDLRADLLLLLTQWQLAAEEAQNNQSAEKPVPAGSPDASRLL